MKLEIKRGNKTEKDVKGRETTGWCKSLIIINALHFTETSGTETSLLLHKVAVGIKFCLENPGSIKLFHTSRFWDYFPDLMSDTVVFLGIDCGLPTWPIVRSSCFGDGLRVPMRRGFRGDDMGLVSPCGGKNSIRGDVRTNLLWSFIIPQEVMMMFQGRKGSRWSVVRSGMIITRERGDGIMDGRDIDMGQVIW